MSLELDFWHYRRRPVSSLEQVQREDIIAGEEAHGAISLSEAAEAHCIVAGRGGLGKVIRDPTLG